MKVRVNPNIVAAFPTHSVSIPAHSSKKVDGRSPHSLITHQPSQATPLLSMFQHLEALRGAPHIMRRQLLLILLWLLSSSSCSSLLHIIDWSNVSALKTRGHHHRTRHITSLPSSLPGHIHADDAQKDWARYSLHLSYKKAGGILYKQSILTPAEFTTLQMAIDQMNLKLTDEKESSFATNRIGALIGKESDVHRILSCSEGSLCRLVSGLADDDDGSHEEELGKMILSPDIPIEVSPSWCIIMLHSEESSSFYC